MAAGEAVRVVGEQLNLGEQSKSLGLEGIKEVGHTGFNLNQKRPAGGVKRQSDVCSYNE